MSSRKAEKTSSSVIPIPKGMTTRGTA
jgi:hypothetical protein